MSNASNLSLRTGTQFSFLEDGHNTVIVGCIVATQCKDLKSVVEESDFELTIGVHTFRSIPNPSQTDFMICSPIYLAVCASSILPSQELETNRQEC
jgi:hypothetical protein